MVASILKIVITRNTICDNLVDFPKSGHNGVSQGLSHYVGTWNFRPILNKKDPPENKELLNPSEPLLKVIASSSIAR